MTAFDAELSANALSQQYIFPSVWCVLGDDADTRVGEVFQLVVHPKFGYSHPDCQLPAPKGVVAGEETHFVMQLLNRYPQVCLAITPTDRTHEFRNTLLPPTASIHAFTPSTTFDAGCGSSFAMLCHDQ